MKEPIHQDTSFFTFSATLFPLIFSLPALILFILVQKKILPVQDDLFNQSYMWSMLAGFFIAGLFPVILLLLKKKFNISTVSGILLFFGMVFLSIGLPLLGAQLYFESLSNDLSSAGISSIGQVTGIKTMKNISSDMHVSRHPYKITFSYQYRNNKYKTASYTWKPDPKPETGQKVPIKFLPYKPDFARIQGMLLTPGKSSLFVSVPFTAIGILFFVLLGFVKNRT